MMLQPPPLQLRPREEWGVGGAVQIQHRAVLLQ
jgi:hypothetical protein